MNALACADHNANLGIAWTAVDELVPLRDDTLPLQEEDEADDEGGVDGTAHLSSATRLKAIAAITAMTLIIHNLHEKAKKLHITHTHGRVIATKFEEDDTMAQGTDGERLKRAIKADKEEVERKKLHASTTSRGRGRYNNYSRAGTRGNRYYDDRDKAERPATRRRERACFICDSKDHMANDCPKRHKKQ